MDEVNVNREDDQWNKIRDIFVNVLETAINLQASSTSSSTSSNKRPRLSSSHPSQHEEPGPSGLQVSTNSTPYEEHRRLFGHKPSKRYSGKNKTTSSKGYKPKKRGVDAWMKEVICLRYCNQDTVPDTFEKIKLAKMNLGLRPVSFEPNGNAMHVHVAIIEAFPALKECGGYTLLRVSEHSRKLVAIEGSTDGIDVPFLRDIVRQAKLYVRPLQSDIPMMMEEIDENKPYLGDEPMELCKKCDRLFAMSILRKHIVNCVEKDSVNEVAQEHDTESESGTIETTVINPPDSEIDDPGIQDVLLSTYSTEESKDCYSILQQHRILVLAPVFEDEEVFIIEISNENVLEDSFNIFRKFDDHKHRDIIVKFKNESGVDGGGLTREFFSLVMTDIKRNKLLFDGPATHRIIRHNIGALQEKKYFYIGKLIALSIIFGGQGPHCFSQSIVNYLFHGLDSVQPCITDIPDPAIQKSTEKIEEATSDDEFQKIICSDECSFIYNCGITKPLLSLRLSDKNYVIKSICLHFTVLSCMAELQQLKTGLETFKFYELMKQHPDIFKKEFLYEVKLLTPDYILQLYNVIYSPLESNQRKIETNLIALWETYLKEKSNITDPSLNDVFLFLTGCSEVPPLGFPGCYPVIKFFDKSFVKVSTCALNLYIQLL